MIKENIKWKIKDGAFGRKIVIGEITYVCEYVYDPRFADINYIKSRMIKEMNFGIFGFIKEKLETIRQSIWDIASSYFTDYNKIEKADSQVVDLLTELDK